MRKKLGATERDMMYMNADIALVENTIDESHMQ